MFGCTFTSFSYTIYTKFHVLLNCSDTNLLLWNNRSYLFFHTVSFIWQYGTTLPLLKFNSLLILILSYPNIITSTDLFNWLALRYLWCPLKKHILSILYLLDLIQIFRTVIGYRTFLFSKLIQICKSELSVFIH